MKKFIKYILIFSVITALMLCPFSGCFAVFAEAASVGLEMAIAQSAGISLTGVSGHSVNDINTFWEDEIGLEKRSYSYSPSQGTITVSALTYNGVLEALANKWPSNSPQWTPSSLNKSGTLFNSWFELYPLDRTHCQTILTNGVPTSVIAIEDRWNYTTNFNILYGVIGQLHTGDVINLAAYSYSFDRPYCVMVPQNLRCTSSPPSVNNRVGNAVAALGANGSTYTVPPQYDGFYFFVNFDVNFAKLTNQATTLSGLSPFPIQNAPIVLPAFSVSGFVPGDATSATFEVEPIEVETDGTTEVLQGKEAIKARKIANPEGKSVTISPVTPGGVNPLIGVSLDNINDVLSDMFFENVTSIVQDAVGDIGDLMNPPADDDINTEDMIYGEVSWIRQLLQKIDNTLDSIKDAVLSILNGSGDGPPPAIMQPPDWLGGGDGGLSFHIGGIWHYVLSWVGSMAAGLGLIASVWAGLPPAMTAAIWGSAVVVIVVGLFKRYVA